MTRRMVVACDRWDVKESSPNIVEAYHYDEIGNLQSVI